MPRDSRYVHGEVPNLFRWDTGRGMKGMNNTTAPDFESTLPDWIEMKVAELEREMPHLHSRVHGALAIANAWAERHDAIVALTPPESRADVEQRLRRIGIRWGVMAGARMTQEFQVMGRAPGHAAGGMGGDESE